MAEKSAFCGRSSEEATMDPRALDISSATPFLDSLEAKDHESRPRWRKKVSNIIALLLFLNLCGVAYISVKVSTAGCLVRGDIAFSEPIHPDDIARLQTCLTLSAAAPAREALEYQSEKFDHVHSVYVGPPSEQLDKAWNKLLRSML